MTPKSVMVPALRSGMKNAAPRPEQETPLAVTALFFFVEFAADKPGERGDRCFGLRKGGRYMAVVLTTAESIISHMIDAAIALPTTTCRLAAYADVRHSDLFFP